MPYVAPEVLNGKRYTQAADIYSFGMFMYVVASGIQPFTGCSHDEVLALKICMQCFAEKIQQHYEIEEQFKKTQECRKANFLSIKNGQSITHKQAIYTSRLLNSFTQNLPKYDNISSSTLEITDFTK
ncbi:kinase-like domain-containing protein [Rhizophagus clarus]|uniref:Kinase-like domain-containing protein n=1 Tax=Rhizophagus clarus TaxID=94130 RepID=A0A8H3R3Y7_9GLOM|nr:kinase-like domain-containing protein [Rhizophagus clarus]